MRETEEDKLKEERDMEREGEICRGRERDMERHGEGD